MFEALPDRVARELEVAATFEAVLVPLSKVKVALLTPVVNGPMALAVAVAGIDPEPEAGATSVIEAQAVPDVVINEVGTAVPELWPLNVEVMTHWAGTTWLAVAEPEATGLTSAADDD